MRAGRLELPRLSTRGPKPRASANFATPASVQILADQPFDLYRGLVLGVINRYTWSE